MQIIARIVKVYLEIIKVGNNHSKGVANLLREEQGVHLTKKNSRIGVYPLDNNFKFWI